MIDGIPVLLVIAFLVIGAAVSALAVVGAFVWSVTKALDLIVHRL